MSLRVLALPALAAGHGIHLPHTHDPEEARQIGMESMKHIKTIVEDCRHHVEECKAANGWEAQIRCLIAGHEQVKDEACFHKVLAAAEHLPVALFAMEQEFGVEFPFGPVTNYGCNASTDPHPYTWSYHIHVQFTKENQDIAEKFAGDFREQFMGGRENYNVCRSMAFLEDLWNFDSVAKEDVERHHFAKPCQQFMINASHTPFTAGGPFLHHNTGFTVSPLMWHEVLPWVMANRPDIDGLWIMTHPNTGCQYNDVKHWSGWAGESSKLFYGILGERGGCLWAGCNNKVLGCIAFNHLGKNEGYGECFDPPLNWEKPFSATGTMTLLPGSNITDMNWEGDDAVIV